MQRLIYLIDYNDFPDTLGGFIIYIFRDTKKLRNNWEKLNSTGDFQKLLALSSGKFTRRKLTYQQLQRYLIKLSNDYSLVELLSL